MSTHRPPRGWGRALQDAERVQRTGGERFSRSASPVPESAGAVARALAGAANSQAEAHKVDLFTLASAGAQDLTLSFLPSADSWNVTLNGIEATDGTDFTISGQTLSLLSPLDARTSDVVRVQYDYLTGVPASPGVSTFLLNIPFQSAGWKYHVLTSSGDLANYVDPAYDDSTWAVGAAPLGVGAYTDVDGHAKATTVPAGSTGALGHFSDFVVRRLIPPGTGITLTLDFSNYCFGVYVDGTSIGFSSSTGAPHKIPITMADQAAPWLLAVYITVANGYTDGGVDLEITGTDPP